MDCTLIDRELLALHFDALDDAPRDAVEAHLVGCAGCVSRYLALKRAIERPPRDGGGAADVEGRPSDVARARLRAAVAREVAGAERRAGGPTSRPAGAAASSGERPAGAAASTGERPSRRWWRGAAGVAVLTIAGAAAWVRFAPPRALPGQRPPSSPADGDGAAARGRAVDAPGSPPAALPSVKPRAQGGSSAGEPGGEPALDDSARLEPASLTVL